MATNQITNRQIKDDQITNAKVSSSAAIASTKLATWSADRNAGNNKLTNLAQGTAATDAVTKAQLDAAITASAAGLAVKQPVRVASTANVSATYNSTGGSSARGQFTAAPNTLDGVSLAVGNRILLKNQSTGAQNGIWVVTTVGTGSNGVWDRATDFDSDSEVTDSVFVLVQEGTQATTNWVLTTNAPITVGGASGTSLTWAQFAAGQTYTADETTLTVSSNQFSIKSGGVGSTQLATDSVTSAKIAANAVGSSELADDAVDTNAIQDDAVTQAKIAAGAVGTTELGADAVTSAKLADDAVGSEHIQTGAVGSSEIATGAVTTAKIAAGAVTTTELGADAVTSAKIADNAIGNEHLQDNAVDTNEIADDAVTQAKIADDAVGSAQVKFIVEAPTGTINGSNTNFTLSQTPGSSSQMMGFLNGIFQRYTTDYTVSGTTVTMTTAPETGDNLYFGYWY